MSKKQTNNKQQQKQAARGAAASDTAAFAADEAILRVNSTDANNSSSLYNDLAYWQTRAFDLQNEITSLEEQRKQRQIQSLDKIKQTLRAAQEQLKSELGQNMELNAQVSDLTLRQSEQRQVLEHSTQELGSIRQKLKHYRDTTQQKDDQSKMTKAVANVHQAENLTELTMLALKITEEMKRGEANDLQINGTESGH